MRVCEALREASAALTRAGCSEPALDAELLLMHATGWSRERLYRELNAEVDDEVHTTYRDLISRRADREPIAYIRGVKEFHGLDFIVSPDVLVPRPETEILVDEAIRRAPDGAVIADAGTGSGNIAVAIAVARPDVRVVATDISAAAIRVARVNAKKHGVDSRVGFVRASFLSALRRESFDIVVSNPPYVATEDESGLMDEVRRFEPPSALYAGKGGLDLLRTVTEQARVCLRPGGRLLMEFGFGQGGAVRSLFGESIWDAPELIEDLQGFARAVRVRLR